MTTLPKPPAKEAAAILARARAAGFKPTAAAVAATYARNQTRQKATASPVSIPRGEAHIKPISTQPAQGAPPKSSGRIPRPPSGGGEFGPPVGATAAERTAWQNWWNARPKRGTPIPVTPPTGGAS